MAVLEKIRNRAGALISVFIGLALLTFVLNDLLTSGSIFSSNNSLTMATINGKKISYKDFVREQEIAEIFYKASLGRDANEASLSKTQGMARNMTWEYMTGLTMLSHKFDEIGIGVGEQELFSLIQGENTYWMVRQLFIDRETGELNKALVINAWKSIETTQDVNWPPIAALIERNAIFDRQREKFFNIISKGLTATTIEAKNMYEANNRKADIEYVMVDYNTVPDKEVAVTNNDVKQYYKRNKHSYEQQESRDIAYVEFEVQPSEADLEMVVKRINKLNTEYREITDLKEAEQFAKLNTDVPFEIINYKKDELPEIISDSMFANKKGYTYGPYRENNSYKIARLIDVNYIPDSVKVRHILIQANNDITEERAEELADSIMGAVKKDTSVFAMLAKQYSADPGSKETGGFIDWFTEGKMMKEFSDSCFLHKKGEVVKTQTQYGFHIIEILDQTLPLKKTKVAIVECVIEPGTETRNEMFRKASEFFSKCENPEAFNKAVEEMKLTLRTKQYLNPMENSIPGLESSRSLVQWAFQTKEKKVADEVMTFENKYVVACVSMVRQKGIAPLENVSDEIEKIIRKEKKGKIISERITALNAKSLNDVASKFSVQVNKSEGLTFSSFILPGEGKEDKVIAAALYMQKGILSKPVSGENGVYVIKVNNLTDEKSVDNKYREEKNRINQEYYSQSTYELLNALKNQAKIKDVRYKFF